MSSGWTLGSYLRHSRVDGAPYMTQRQVAKALGESVQWWSQIEADRVKPPRELLPDFADLLRADLDLLLTLWDSWTKAPPVNLLGGPCSGRRP